GARGTDAPAGEGTPGSFGLRQAVSDHRERRDVMAHPAVAALDHDVLAARALVLEAALPGDDAIAPADDRGAGHREGKAQPVGPRVGAAAGAEQARDVAREGIAEGARQRDHLTHVVRPPARQLARVDAAEAPADETHRPTMAGAAGAEGGREAPRHAGRRGPGAAPP